jgi:hypothetical protein
MRDKYPNLAALADGRVSGHVADWPFRSEIRALFKELASARAVIETISKRPISDQTDENLALLAWVEAVRALCTDWREREGKNG